MGQFVTDSAFHSRQIYRCDAHRASVVGSDDASGDVQQHEPARNAGKREKEKDGPRRRGFSLFMRLLNSNRVSMGN